MFSLWLAWFCMIDLTSRRTWNNGHCIIFMKTGSPLRTLRIAAPPPQWYFWRVLLLFEIRIKLEKYRQIMAEKKRASFIWQVFFSIFMLEMWNNSNIHQNHHCGCAPPITCAPSIMIFFEDDDHLGWQVLLIVSDVVCKFYQQQHHSLRIYNVKLNRSS